MPVKARNLILTDSQAACLIALRHCKDSKSKIAIEAKLDLIKTAAALGALARLHKSHVYPLNQIAFAECFQRFLIREH